VGEDPLEFLYYNIHGEGACEIGGIQAKALPFGEELVLNHTDNSLNRELKDWLKGQFPESRALGNSDCV
jgi:hypothetical protein